MLFPRSLQRTLLKILSLFSLVRGYNIAILVIAQYLTARYILSPETGWWNLVFDLPFFCIVAASALTTAAGYIINNFYDAAKDQINRPKKGKVKNQIPPARFWTQYITRRKVLSND